MVAEYNGWFVVDPIGLYPQEAPHNIKVLMLWISFIFLPSAGMLIAGGSAGKFIGSSFGVFGNILPVPVATNDERVFISSYQVANKIAFETEILVRMVVFFFEDDLGQ